MMVHLLSLLSFNFCPTMCDTMLIPIFIYFSKKSFLLFKFKNELPLACTDLHSQLIWYVAEPVLKKGLCLPQNVKPTTVMTAVKLHSKGNDRLLSEIQIVSNVLLRKLLLRQNTCCFLPLPLQLLLYNKVY